MFTPLDWDFEFDFRVGFVPAYALQQILAALAEDGPDSRRTTYYWAAVVFVAHLSFAQLDLFQSWHTRRCYERTRGQLFCSLHYKSLRRQNLDGQVKKTEQGQDEESGAHLGKIVNLMQSVFSIIGSILFLPACQRRHVRSFAAFLGVFWLHHSSHPSRHCACVPLQVSLTQHLYLLTQHVFF